MRGHNLGRTYRYSKRRWTCSPAVSWLKCSPAAGFQDEIAYLTFIGRAACYNRIKGVLAIAFHGVTVYGDILKGDTL